MAGERARNAVSEMLLGIGGRTAQSTAADGLIGAHMTVQQLAVFSQDPYLTVLATALEQLRVGQVHPWLVPPRFQSILNGMQAKCSVSGPFLSE